MRADYLAELLADTPRALWDCQDASGNPQDASGNGLHMTAISAGADYHEEGPMDVGTDFAIRLIGGETIQRSSHISTVTDDFTIILFVDVQDVTANDQILFYNGNSGANGYGVVVDADGTFQYLCGGVALGASSVQMIEALGFAVIGVQRAAGTWRYFVNGRLVNANAGTTAPGTPSGTVVLGSGSLQTAYSYVAFYESVLSEARMLEHYIATSRAVVRDFAVNSTGAVDTTFEADIPADVQPDDLLLCVFSAVASAIITPPDASWKRAPRFGGHDGLVHLDGQGWAYYKEADGTESGTVTFTSDTSRAHEAIVLSIANANLDFPFGYARSVVSTDDANVPGINSPFDAGLGLVCIAYNSARDEATDSAFFGGAAGNWAKRALADTGNLGIIVADNSLNPATRNMDGAPGGGTAIQFHPNCDSALMLYCINSLGKAPPRMERLWWAKSNSNLTPTALAPVTTTEEGIAQLTRVLLPGMVIWGFVMLVAGEAVTLTDWQTTHSDKEFTQVIDSPFDNSEAADRLRSYVGYLPSLEEQDCFVNFEAGGDGLEGALSAGCSHSCIYGTYIGPNPEMMLIPEGTWEETTVASSTPDQGAVQVPADNSIVLVMDAVAAAGAVTVPSGYAELSEIQNTSGGTLTVGEKIGVPAGSEDPGAWATPSARHNLYIVFPSMPEEVVTWLPQIIAIQS